MTGSLAYRKNEPAIRRGHVPDKYTRLLPYIPGDKVLEIGSAEGVLALLMARADQGAKKEVTALERQPERHAAAVQLHADWSRKFRFSAGPKFINGAIGDNLKLLEGIDTLVAVRMIYYLGDELDTVFAEVGRQVPNVVLCGNHNRANRDRAGIKEITSADNYYASSEGMKNLLTCHGYRIVTEVTEGDEIVVGVKDG